MYCEDLTSYILSNVFYERNFRKFVLFFFIFFLTRFFAERDALE
jgi:hypothetical protein